MPRLAALVFVFLALALSGCHVEAPRADTQALATRGFLANRFVRADKDTPVAARLLIETRASELAGRPPVNLALVVDTSGSMEGRAIDDARAASKALLSALRPKDRIAVVAFGGTTEILLPSTPIESADLPRLQQRIDAMRASGTTDMAGGLRAGMDEVRRHFDADGVNRVILLGDGDPNETPPVNRLAALSGERGVSITSLGLGPDYNETLMGAIAQVSGGRFHYVADSSKVAAFFGAEVVRLNRTYARNATLELTAGPGAHFVKVVGRAERGRKVSIPIGDLSFGEQREIVVKLMAPPRRAGAAVELFDAVLRFEDVRAHAVVERRIFFGAHAVAGEEAFLAGRDEAAERAIARADAAAATLEAIEAARRGDLEHAQRSLRGAPSGNDSKGGGAGYVFSDDVLLEALPSVAPGRQAPARESEIVKKAHDRAMEVLQTQ